MLPDEDPPSFVEALESLLVVLFMGVAIALLGGIGFAFAVYMLGRAVGWE